MNSKFKRTDRYQKANRAADRFETVSKILGSALKKAGLESDIARYRFVLHWNEIVGSEIGKRSKPECIRNGALVVRVDSSAWAQELTFQKSVILSRLKKFLEESPVNEAEELTDVQFYVGALA